jgi:RNA polymerase sigma-70 factor (ECF subfamily)
MVFHVAERSQNICEGFCRCATISFWMGLTFVKGGRMSGDERVWRERGLRAAVLAGDETAWKALYEESFAGLYAYALWRCAGLRDVADEVVQDTWLTAVRRIGRFDPARGGFADWLRGIAVNILRNHLRRERRTWASRSAIGRRLAERVAHYPASDRERAERIAHALAALPERYEAVLRAKYLDGRAVADIAAASGETPKAVESLLTRARQAFRDAYGTED